MQRYQLVIGGTVAGIAGVLAFPTTKAHLTIPSASASTGGHSSSSSSATTGSTAGGSGSTATTGGTSSSTSSATRTATSSTEGFQYGDIAVTVTVKGSTITKVSIATINETDGRSVQIDQYAIPQLEQQVISAGSVNIDGVSGATFTSQAFVNAVGNALQKLGISA